MLENKPFYPRRDLTVARTYLRDPSRAHFGLYSARHRCPGDMGSTWGLGARVTAARGKLHSDVSSHRLHFRENNATSLGKNLDRLGKVSLALIVLGFSCVTYGLQQFYGIFF